MKTFSLIFVLALALISTEARRSRARSQLRSNNFNDESPLANEEEGNDRNGKFISLFNVVTFKQTSCTTTTGVIGTCLSTAECTQRSNSVAAGNCAAGFGVCCLTQIQTCGTTVSDNCTYIQNPGYSSTYTTAGTCTYTVKQCSSNICRIRLDFDNFNIQGPNQANNAACDLDNLVIGGTNNVATSTFID